MGRIARRYYIIVDKVTGKMEENCLECRAVSQSSVQEYPVSDSDHVVKEVNRDNHQLMIERETGVKGFKYKWDIQRDIPILTKNV